MATAQESWTEVGKVLDGLALKVKMHLEATQGAGDHIVEAMNDAMAGVQKSVEVLANALGDAVRDPAIRDDVRSVAASFSDAIANTIAEARPRTTTATSDKGEVGAA